MKTWGDFKIELPANGGVERFTTCPACSPTRKKKNAKCLSVNIDKGVWNCHHCGWKGTLKAGEEVRPKLDRWKPPVYARPTYTASDAGRTTELYEFFLNRGIEPETVDRYGISLVEKWMPQLEDRVTCIAFPYLRGGTLINVKYRTLVGKEFRQEADAEKILYGLEELALPSQEPVIIVEGECDKLAFAQAGLFRCLSVPDGAPAENAKPSAKKFEYLENCESELNAIDRLIIATDNDPPGHALKDELLRRLGPERCWTVIWPDGIKDANQLLIEQGAEAVQELIRNARPSPIEHVLAIEDLCGSLIEYYRHGRQRGLSTGYGNLDELFTISPGQFTLVTGVPGHGKSEFMDQLMVNLILNHGCVFGVCSPENRPIPHHLAKLAEKIVNKPFLPGQTERMSPQEVTMAMDQLWNHLYMIDAPEPLSVIELLEKARALVLQKGITHLLLDPWNEFDHTRPGNQTETDYISSSISRMKTFGHRHQVHVTVIAHPTKMQRDPKTGRYPVPSPYDVSGSAHWRNKSDNCLTVWRDTSIPNDEAAPIDPRYTEVHVTKVRWKQNGRIGKVAFTWDAPTGRYFETDIREGLT